MGQPFHCAQCIRGLTQISELWRLAAQLQVNLPLRHAQGRVHLGNGVQLPWPLVGQWCLSPAEPCSAQLAGGGGA